MSRWAEAWRVLTRGSAAPSGTVEYAPDYASPPKASSVAGLAQVFGGGQVVHTPRRYDRLADEAYCQNIVAFQCVRLISDAFGSLRLLPFRDDDELPPEHELARLMRSPQPGRGAARFLQQWAGFHLLAGTSYVEGVRPSPRRPPRELYALRPDRVTAVLGQNGHVAAWRYETAAGKRDFPIEVLTGYGDLLQCRDFHPLNDHYGMGPVEAAAAWIDLDNAGADLNAASLQNGANPSTAFMFKQQLSPEQINAARAQIDARYAGIERTGSSVVLGGDWSVQRISQTMAEMQWTEGMRESARRTCGAWGVPHVLVVPGESTYANRENAALELWEHTVLPFADRQVGDLVPWLRWAFRDDRLDLKVDRDAIVALAPRRKEARESAVKGWDAGLITRDEARDELDYEAAEVDGDKFKTASPSQAPPPPALGAPAGGGGQAPGGAPRPGGDPRGDPGAPKPQVPAAPRPAAPALRVVQGGRASAGEVEVKKPLPRELATSPLYVALGVEENSALALHAWAEARGIANVVPPEQMHVTVVYSRAPVPAFSLPEDLYPSDEVYPDSYALALFNNALVLTFESWWTTHLHEEAIRLGATWDHPEYVPHVTLSYDPGEARPDTVPTFAIRLGKATAEALDIDESDPPPHVDDEAVEVPPAHGKGEPRPRVPKGMPGAGRFVRLAVRGGDGYGFAGYLRGGRKPVEKPEGDPEPGASDGAGKCDIGVKAAPFDDIDPDDLVDDAALADSAAPAVADAMRDFARRVFDRVGFEADFDVYDPRVADYLQEFGGERIRGMVGQTTRDAIGKAIADVTREGPTFPKLVEAIRGVFGLASEERAALIARTETTRAAAFGTQKAMEQAGVERKEWLSSRDLWVRDTHTSMDGQIVPADDDFVSPSGAKGQGPGLMGRADEDCNCRCVVIPLPDEAAAARHETKEARDVAWKAEADVVARHAEEVEKGLRSGFALQEMVAVARLQKRLKG